MGKKLIDYLHLYLKSPFLVIPQYQSDRKSLIAYIKQLPLSGTEIEFVEEDNEVPAFYAFLPDVKPILRKLSDITEEEKVAMKLNLFQYNNLCTPNEVMWSFEQVVYLLNREFDLFGLMDLSCC